MDITKQTKSSFIKFNVSEQFKSLTEQKAREHGMSVSELGRTLFGAFVMGIATPTVAVSPDLIALSKRAHQQFQKGKGTRVHTEDELEEYLSTL